VAEKRHLQAKPPASVSAHDLDPWKAQGIAVGMHVAGVDSKRGPNARLTRGTANLGIVRTMRIGEKPQTTQPQAIKVFEGAGYL
jgi:hypothetical protein